MSRQIMLRRRIANLQHRLRQARQKLADSTRPEGEAGYTYDQLDEKAQVRAREWFLEGGYPGSSEMVTEDFEQELEHLGYPTDKIEWNLSYNQGDGVAFYGFADSEVLLPRVLQDASELSFLLGPDVDVDIEIWRNDFGYHYSHYNTMGVDITIHSDDPNTDTLEDELQEIILEDVREVSKRLQREGYETLKHYESEEAVAEDILSNEYIFDELGNRL